MSRQARPSEAATAFQTTNGCTTLILDDGAGPDGSGTVSSTLNPSLLSDLRRFADEGTALELLPALAACVRHARPLALHLELHGVGIGAAIQPRQQLYRADRDLCALLPSEMAQIRLLQIEPEPAADSRSEQRLPHVGPMRPLLWKIAMEGARAELLPEIDGPVRYRMAFGISLSGLQADSGVMQFLQCLRLPVSLDELRSGTGLGSPAIQRLLNALYRQSGLMISRAFPVRARREDRDGPAA